MSSAVGYEEDAAAYTLDAPDALDAPPLDPQTATAEELVDEETRESYNNILATQKFIATSQEDQRILQLQQAEIVDLLERADELGKNEYFNVKYFTSETKKVWSEREEEDRTSTSDSRPNAVRLFPNAASAEHQQRLRDRLREDHALDDREELKRRHPLLFNRVVRDESRRALFSTAMEARRRYNMQISDASHMPLLLLQNLSAATHAVNDSTVNATADSCASSVLYASKAPSNKAKAFHSLPQYIREGVQAEAQLASDHARQVQEAAALSDGSESSPNERTWQDDVDTKLNAAQGVVAAVTATVKKPMTLMEMLSDQRQQLHDLAEAEETKYRPLLKSYFAYDEAVRQKLDALADRLSAIPVTAASNE